MNDLVYLEMVEHTRLYPQAGTGSHDAIIYCALGLSGEAGEIANQVKKIMRDDGFHLTPDRLSKIKDELGDVLWYVYALADELGVEVDYLRQSNADKLLNRKANDAIHGDRRPVVNYGAGHVHYR